LLQLLTSAAKGVAILPMRTTIVIDEKLMKLAMRVSGARTKSEAIRRGLELIVRLAEQGRLLRSTRGKLH
jgi:hypothetical protein